MCSGGAPFLWQQQGGGAGLWWGLETQEHVSFPTAFRWVSAAEGCSCQACTAFVSVLLQHAWTAPSGQINRTLCLLMNSVLWLVWGIFSKLCYWRLSLMCKTECEPCASTEESLGDNAISALDEYPCNAVNIQIMLTFRQALLLVTRRLG